MNKFKKSLFLITVLCIALAITACSKDNEQNEGIDDKDVMATVNGKAISQEEYDKSLAYFKQDVENNYGEGAWETEARKGLTYKEFYEEALMDNMTMILVLLDAAEKDGIIVSILDMIDIYL